MRYSPFLRDIFNKPVATIDGDLVHGARTNYRLPDTRPDAFRLLSSWFYNQTFDLKEKHENSLVADERSDEVVEHLNECGEQDMDLCQLWILAGILKIPALQNKVITVIYEMHQNCYMGAISPHCYGWVYQYTNPGTPLRNLVLDMVAWAEKKWVMSEIPQAYPQEMLVELIALYQLFILPETCEARQADWVIEDYFVTENQGTVHLSPSEVFD